MTTIIDTSFVCRDVNPDIESTPKYKNRQRIREAKNKDLLKLYFKDGVILSLCQFIVILNIIDIKF